MWGSFRDTALVARFELLRSLRNRVAMAIFSLYALLMAGVTWGFTRFLLGIENAAAQAMRVPQVRRPGAMLESLRNNSPELRNTLAGMFGDDTVAAAWLDMDLHILVLVHLTAGLVVLPFIAAFTCSETIAADLRSRSVRYELLRVGRLEFVFGRFVGQALLMGVGALFSAFGTWAVAVFAMTGTNALTTAWDLIWITPRLLIAALPFVALGITCSQLTRSANLARTLSLGAVAGSWILYGYTQEQISREGGGLGWDLVQQALPQTWLDGVLNFGGSLWSAVGLLSLLSFAYVAIGLAAFMRRDL